MITCDETVFGYEDGPRYLANFESSESNLTLITGPNGSGKSTLLKMIAGIVRKYAGSCEVGVSAQDIYMVFADENLFPGMTIQQNLLAVPTTTLHSVTALLKKYELDSLSSKFPGELSSGQRQMVALLRVFLVPHRLILLDEPTNYLSQEISERIIHELCTYIKANAKNMLVVSHDVNIFKPKMDACYEIDKIVECLG